MELPVDPARFAAYLSITAVMVATPGPANLFVMAIGAHRGHAAATAGVLGMTLANLVWFSAAGAGLGALALAWPAVFRTLSWVGASYLVWLGLRALASARHADVATAHAPQTHGGPAFRDGFLVQITNPKALLFITVVLPPFLDPQRPLAWQVLLFASASMTGDFIAMSAYGLSGAAIARRMREPRFRQRFAAFTGLLLIAAAVLIVVSG